MGTRPILQTANRRVLGTENQEVETYGIESEIRSVIRVNSWGLCTKKRKSLRVQKGERRERIKKIA